MRYSALASIALAFTIGGASAVAAQQTPDTQSVRAKRELRARARAGMPAEALLRGIELSDSQKEQIKAIFEKHRPSREEVRKMREHAREIRAREHRAGDEARDSAAIRRRREEAIERVVEERAQLHQDIRSVLTSEQQAQFDRNLEEIRQRAKQRVQERRELRQRR